MTLKEKLNIKVAGQRLTFYQTDIGLVVSSKEFWSLFGYRMVPKTKTFPVEYQINGSKVLIFADALMFVSEAQSRESKSIVGQLIDFWIKTEKPEFAMGQSRVIPRKRKKVIAFYGKKEVYFDVYSFISAFFGKVDKGFIAKRFLFWRKFQERQYKGGVQYEQERCLVSWTQIQKMLRESRRNDKHEIYGLLEKFINDPISNSQPLYQTESCLKTGVYRLFDIENEEVDGKPLRIIWHDNEWMASVLDVGKILKLRSACEFLKRDPIDKKQVKAEICNRNFTTQFREMNFVSVRELKDYLDGNSKYKAENLKKVLSKYIDPIKKGSNQRSDPTKCSRHLYSHL